MMVNNMLSFCLFATRPLHLDDAIVAASASFVVGTGRHGNVRCLAFGGFPTSHVHLITLHHHFYLHCCHMRSESDTPLAKLVILVSLPYVPERSREELLDKGLDPGCQ